MREKRPRRHTSNSHSYSHSHKGPSSLVAAARPRTFKTRSSRAHKVELARIKRKKGAASPKPISRELTKLLGERVDSTPVHIVEDSKMENSNEMSTTYAFWEGGSHPPKNTEHSSKKEQDDTEGNEGAMQQYMHELEALADMSFCQQLKDETFINGFLLPDSTLKIVWDWTVIMFVLYNCVICPFQVTFPLQMQALDYVDYLTNGILLFDVLVSFRTAYCDHWNNIIATQRLVVIRYISGRFWLDMIGSLPFSIIAHTFLHVDAGVGVDFVECLSIIRIGRVFTSPRLAGPFFSKPHMRILVLMGVFTLTAHWVGLLFYYVGTHQSLDGERGEVYTISWVEKARLSEADIFARYITALYWAMTTMVTVGYGDISANTPYERLLNIPVMIMSTLLYAAIFGNVSYAVESMSSTFRRYQGKMDKIAEFAALFQLPTDLTFKLYGYTEEIFHQNKGFDLEDMLGNLPRSVRADILIFLHPRIMETVPLFDGVTENFVEAMILKLKFMVCLSDDYVFRQHDMSKEMYLLRTGIVEVEVEGKGVVGDLGQGSHFGEIGMLLGTKRSSSIRAVTKCELSYLRQDDFVDLLYLFPDYEVNVRAKANKHMLKTLMEKGKDEFLKQQLNFGKFSFEDAANPKDKGLSRNKTLLEELKRLEEADKKKAGLHPLEEEDRQSYFGDFFAKDQDLFAKDQSLPRLEKISFADPGFEDHGGSDPPEDKKKRTGSDPPEVKRLKERRESGGKTKPPVLVPYLEAEKGSVFEKLKDMRNSVGGGGALEAHRNKTTPGGPNGNDSAIDELKRTIMWKMEVLTNKIDRLVAAQGGGGGGPTSNCRSPPKSGPKSVPEESVPPNPKAQLIVVKAKVPELPTNSPKPANEVEPPEPARQRWASLRKSIFGISQQDNTVHPYENRASNSSHREAEASQIQASRLRVNNRNRDQRGRAPRVTSRAGSRTGSVAISRGSRHNSVSQQQPSWSTRAKEVANAAGMLDDSDSDEQYDEDEDYREDARPMRIRNSLIELHNRNQQDISLLPGSISAHPSGSEYRMIVDEVTVTRRCSAEINSTDNKAEINATATHSVVRQIELGRLAAKVDELYTKQGDHFVPVSLKTPATFSPPSSPRDTAERQQEHPEKHQEQHGHRESSRTSPSPNLDGSGAQSSLKRSIASPPPTDSPGSGPDTPQIVLH